ncbi:MAG: glycosyltransferase [Halobacteriovoraceae bacterium]|nr:glycosyltransferase [Halobacteriovoraceae bacterium]
MNIVFVHPIKLPVTKYGGTERVVYWLMKALVHLGHNVTLIGTPDSEVGSIGVKLVPWVQNESYDWRHLLPHNYDVIHSSTRYDELVKDLPFLLTIHGIGQIGESFPVNTVFVSKKHAQIHGSDQFVYNGLDMDEYPYVPIKRGQEKFVFLAKASWKVKNLKDCIKAVKKANKHLDVAGGKGISFSSNITYRGMIGQQQKMQLLRNSDALLFPVRWHEPFGLAVIEAMTQGLPAIVSPYGSLPELVIPEVGVICENYYSFQQSIIEFPRTFDSDQIRNYTLEHFTSLIMAENYIQKYKKIIDGRQLASVSPKYCLEKEPQELLPF